MGKRQTVRIVVRSTDGKVIKGMRVTVKGPGISVTGKTNAKGVLIVKIRPTSPGILRISAGTRCSKRLGILGAFQPPVTG